ncbi:MAG: hypothetical protein H6559_37380 [Lewinellaceae bacterium]|nr:hypothetical protein [Lewinellaceae bacterium]
MAASSASPTPPLPVDGCQDMASCNATFTVGADDLTVDCPADPMLPMLQRRRHTSTYNAWVSFSFDGGCDVSDNSASIPATAI